jgi:hypothetical protein
VKFPYRPFGAIHRSTPEAVAARFERAISQMVRVHNPATGETRTVPLLLLPAALAAGATTQWQQVEVLDLDDVFDD